jgi:UDP-glucuronate 4-epimerase
VLLPISPYAATKVSGELLGHVYSHLYGIRFIALRFFTVYGPRQRPDLAIHKFAESILAGQPIPIFGDGSTSRDYTYVGDIVSGIRAAIDYSGRAYEVINLGNNRPTGLLDMVRALEDTLNEKAILDFLPEQPGDVPWTLADIRKAKVLLNYEPKTSFTEGLARFAAQISSRQVCS